jgi:hypothetical protein
MVNLVVSGSCVCLSLPRFKLSCLDFLETELQLGNRWRTLRLEFGHSAATKIEFSYLNDNLMVPIVHPLSLTFDFSSPKGGPLKCEDGFDESDPPHFYSFDRKNSARRGEPMILPGEPE